jgi:feruloyl esterase
MSRANLATLLAILLFCALPVVSSAQEPARDQADRCDDLAGAGFSGIADAPTQIASSVLVAATAADPAYCHVTGSIESRIGIDLRMPERGWNGKFMEVGCGGWCGTILSSFCKDPLRRGYACIASDMGHKGTPVDVQWAQNNLQGQLDFGFRATHVAAVAGKAIAAQYYGARPTRSYFVGCSTGGYQGVTAAQRFPWDFDGIVAGAPDIDQTHANFRALWLARVKRDAAGNQLLGKQDMTLLHDAALALCDRDDGVKDGIIGNPRGCKFKPEAVLCKSGETSGCLSSKQVDAAKKIYAGPMNSAGEPTSTGSFLVGSELAWGAEWPTKSLEDFFRYGLPGYSTGPDWKYTDVDFDRDYQRFGLAPHFENSNPDLRRFEAAGGKLIVYHGTTDTVDPPAPVIDYYETVEKTMGGRKNTQDFFRLFLIPGMDHCVGGVGAMNVDWLRELEDWVENGKAPDVIVGTHAGRNNEPGFTRPLYPYPAYAKYKGKGDVNRAENFVPISGKP